MSLATYNACSWWWLTVYYAVFLLIKHSYLAFFGKVYNGKNKISSSQDRIKRVANLRSFILLLEELIFFYWKNYSGPR
jgi:hypothetical protein